MHLILYGDPRTKKNSARILKAHANRRIVAPSEAFMQYQEKCLWQIKRPYNPITARVNVRCVYYMATRRKVDLANLIEATTDILVKATIWRTITARSWPLTMAAGWITTRKTPEQKSGSKKWRQIHDPNLDT